MGSPNKFGLEFRVQGLCVCAGGNGRRGELHTIDTKNPCMTLVTAAPGLHGYEVLAVM